MWFKRLFQKKTKVEIDAVQVSIPNWEEVENDAEKKAWLNPEKTALIALYFINQVPDLPKPLSNLEQLRAFYRKLIVEQTNGGLMRCEVTDLQGYTAVEVLMKQPDEPKGMIYKASLVLPFRDCSFVINVQAVEPGITGLREAITLNQWMQLEAQKDKTGNELMEGYAADPYDPNFKEGTLMNYADQATFDNDFPDHPLTLVRAKIAAIKASIQLDPSLSGLVPF